MILRHRMVLKWNEIMKDIDLWLKTTSACSFGKGLFPLIAGRWISLPLHDWIVSSCAWYIFIRTPTPKWLCFFLRHNFRLYFTSSLLTGQDWSENRCNWFHCRNETYLQKEWKLPNASSELPFCHCFWPLKRVQLVSEPPRTGKKS
jgi:hypothetical protein